MGWFKEVFARRKIYDDLSDEIEEHLAEKTDTLMAEGASREEAERAARREFGNVTMIKERSREPCGGRGWRFFGPMCGLRYGSLESRPDSLLLQLQRSRWASGQMLWCSACCTAWF
jgi:hypothetical protein